MAGDKVAKDVEGQLKGLWQRTDRIESDVQELKRTTVAQSAMLERIDTRTAQTYKSLDEFFSNERSPRQCVEHHMLIQEATKDIMELQNRPAQCESCASQARIDEMKATQARFWGVLKFIGATFFTGVVGLVFWAIKVNMG